jgi:hypothetical protein
MYREPHLQKKSDECRDLWLAWKEIWDRDNHSKETQEARKKWSECVSEHGKMISHEVKTNPRYKDMRV